MAAAAAGWSQAKAAKGQAAAARSAVEEARKQTGLAEAAAQESARQTVAAERASQAAEDANAQARSHVTLVPGRVGKLVDDYELVNTGNIDATGVWLRRQRTDVEEWRSEPITILANGGRSPTFKAQRHNWPLTAIMDQAPGQITLEYPPKPGVVRGF